MIALVTKILEWKILDNTIGKSKRKRIDEDESELGSYGEVVDEDSILKVKCCACFSSLVTLSLSSSVCRASNVVRIHMKIALPLLWPEEKTGKCIAYWGYIRTVARPC